MKKVTRKISFLETGHDSYPELTPLSLGADLTAFSAIQDLDKSFVGSTHYLGLFPFWNVEYKYELRDVSPKARQAVHHELLRKGKKLSGKSPSIKKIIEKTLSALND